MSRLPPALSGVVAHHWPPAAELHEGGRERRTTANRSVAAVRPSVAGRLEMLEPRSGLKGIS